MTESVIAIRDVNRMETLEELERIKAEDEMDHLEVEIHHDVDW